MFYSSDDRIFCGRDIVLQEKFVVASSCNRILGENQLVELVLQEWHEKRKSSVYRDSAVKAKS